MRPSARFATLTKYRGEAIRPLCHADKHREQKTSASHLFVREREAFFPTSAMEWQLTSRSRTPMFRPAKTARS
ncbi:MAG: hypothetical protein PUF62_09485 [Bacteroidales bacterium]|nr:hypothetical protein [Bacteroidales bacterium]